MTIMWTAGMGIGEGKLFVGNKLWMKLWEQGGKGKVNHDPQERPGLELVG